VSASAERQQGQAKPGLQDVEPLSDAFVKVITRTSDGNVVHVRVSRRPLPGREQIQAELESGARGSNRTRGRDR
jgi:hypothetical protein